MLYDVMWCAGEYSVPTFQPDYSIEEDDEASDSDDGTSHYPLFLISLPSFPISASFSYLFLLSSFFFLLSSPL